MPDDLGCLDESIRKAIKERAYRDMVLKAERRGQKVAIKGDISRPTISCAYCGRQVTANKCSNCGAPK